MIAFGLACMANLTASFASQRSAAFGVVNTSTTLAWRSAVVVLKWARLGGVSL